MSLSALVRRLQDPMYRLALRFLGHPQDAQDATQEILIRIVTHLGSFEGRSRFTMDDHPQHDDRRPLKAAACLAAGAGGEGRGRVLRAISRDCGPTP